MKKTLTQYLYIFLVAFLLLITAIIMIDKEPNPLVQLEEKIKKVEQKEIVLTPKEKEIEQQATEKEWKEVDSNKTK